MERSKDHMLVVSCGDGSREGELRITGRTVDAADGGIKYDAASMVCLKVEDEDE